MQVTNQNLQKQRQRRPARCRLTTDAKNLKAGFPASNGPPPSPNCPEFVNCATRVRPEEPCAGHLDFYLERFEAKVIEQGGQVHWARDDAARPGKSCSTFAVRLPPGG